MELDILAIVAHPDDAELGCGGTLAKHVSLGYKVGVVDLTLGELGTRGTPEIRKKEAEDASKILGLQVRDNLNFRDGFFTHDEEHLLKVIECIRLYKPKIIITNAVDDRHPDHGRAAKLVKEAAWLSGLKNIKTTHNSAEQQNWRPKHVFHIIQYKPLEPDFVVDISGFEEIKMKAIKAFSSQFYNPENKEDTTLIAKPEFIELIRAKDINSGNYALLDKAEGFISAFKPAVDDLFHLK